MKRNSILATLALATALIGANAMAADAVGTVNILGTVGSKCTVVSGGAAGGLTFGTTFGSATTNLADANGRLATTFGPFTSNGNGNFQLFCNNANPIIGLVATSMTTTGTVTAGYANTIKYSAGVDIAAITGAGVTSLVTRTVLSGAAKISSGLGVGLYTRNVANNVIVRASTFSTAAVTDVLMPGAYSGTITLTLTPS